MKIMHLDYAKHVLLLMDYKIVKHAKLLILVDWMVVKQGITWIQIINAHQL